MAVEPLRVEPLGEAALLVTLGEALDADVNARARALASALATGAVDGLGRPVAGHASVLVPFEPAIVDERAVRHEVERCWAAASRVSASSEPAGRLLEIPVRYGGADGPDLAAVAQATGRSEAEVVRLHCSVEYRVLVLGFVPGYAYLGILPAALALPRRGEPRVRVPAGSVAISGRQSGVYPFDGPGGWHLLGRTDVRLWDPVADPPARLAPGDRVRFVPA